MNNIFYVMALFGFVGCTSTHLVLNYKTECKLSELSELKSINEAGIRFQKSKEEYVLCKERKFEKFEIVRTKLLVQHSDGRSFHFDEVKRIVYMFNDSQSCQITVVAPLTGNASDIDDQTRITREYFVEPVFKQLKKSNIVFKEPIYSSTQAFDSESDFRRHCSGL